MGDLADAALASSTLFIELGATAWTTNTVRVMARNLWLGAAFDLVASTLPVTKRQIPHRWLRDIEANGPAVCGFHYAFVPSGTRAW